MHTGLRHHLPVPSQYRGRGPWGRSMKMCGLAVGRRREPILGFLLKLFWREKCLAKMTSHPKEVNISWNHLMHAIEVSKGEV